MSENTLPNIVLINCDDLGYGDLGCYGSSLNRTVAIDQLAQEGMLFTDAYCASPVCTPSRAGLLSGCYPPRIGLNRVLFPGEGLGLNPEEYTLPTLFKEAGYASACIGKWHVGDQGECLPKAFGFDEYYGLPYSNDMGMQAGKTFTWKTPPLPLLHNNEVIEEQPDQRGLTERYVEKSVEFIRKNKKNRFFLYLAQMHVHLPLYAAERFVKQSINGDFGACLEEVDWSVAVLVYELKRLSLYENTLIIFTSDNGSRGDHGASNYPLKGTKFLTYEGGQRIPFIACWKGKIPSGTKNSNIISHIDLLPTFASLLSKTLPPKVTLDGIDVSATLFEKGTKVRDEFVYYGWGNDNKGYLHAIRKGNWKLHLSKWNPAKQENEGTRELYDLSKDIGEQDNLYGKYPEVVQRLSLLFDHWSKKLGNRFTKTEGEECRQCRVVDNPQTLTEYDENHPYIVALYDKDDRG
jgi:arylsulfatase A-like enzyme